MRRTLIHLLLTLIMTFTMLKLGCGVDTLAYWIVLIGCNCIYLNAAID